MEVIDLSDDVVTSEEDNAAKARIMAFARGKLSGAQTAGPLDPSVPSAGSCRGPKRAADAEEEQHDSDSSHGIPMHAKRTRTAELQQGSQPASQPEAAGPAGGLPHPPPNPMNDMLFLLHKEREARMLARQQQAAPSQTENPSQPSNIASQPRSISGTEDNRQSTLSKEGPRHGSRLGSRSGGPGAQSNSQHAGATSVQDNHNNGSSGTIQASVLTYNIWFEEGVHLEARMAGLGRVIRDHSPDFVMLQEVTPNIIKVWHDSNAPWVAQYTILPPPNPVPPYFTLLAARRDSVAVGGYERVPFTNTRMGRDVLFMHARVRGPGPSAGAGGSSQPPGIPLCVGTSHLESPVDAMCGPAREEQLSRAFSLLQSKCHGADIVYGGDTNWLPKSHRSDPVLPPGWQDAWVELRPGDPGRKFNPMTGYTGNRIDKLFLHGGSQWELVSIDMVGTEPLPGGLTTPNRQGKPMPVLISDHFGLLLKLRSKGGVVQGGSGGVAAGVAAGSKGGPGGDASRHQEVGEAAALATRQAGGQQRSGGAVIVIDGDDDDDDELL